MNENRNNNNGGKNSNNNRTGFVVAIIASLCTLLMISVMTNQLRESSRKEISYDEFIRMLDTGKIKTVKLKPNEISITPISQENDYYEITYYTGYVEESDSLAKRLDAAGVGYGSEVPQPTNTLVDFFLIYILPLLAIWAIVWFGFRMISKSSGGMMVCSKRNRRDLQRCCRTGGSKRIHVRAGRLSPQSWKIHKNRRQASKRSPFSRPSRNR